MSKVMYVLPDPVDEEDVLNPQNFMKVATLLSINDLSDYIKSCNGDGVTVSVKLTVDRSGNIIMQYG